MIHVEAPDEAGHEGNVHEKVLAIEQVDSKIIGPILAAKKTNSETFGSWCSQTITLQL